MMQQLLIHHAAIAYSSCSKEQPIGYREEKQGREAKEKPFIKGAGGAEKVVRNEKGGCLECGRAG